MYQAYGVLGESLGHSLSPKLHNSAFQQAGMKRVYFKWEINPGDLGAFMKAVRILPVSGVSVTIPYKEDAMPYLDQVSQEARDMGAVNTLYWRGNALCGENTDYTGFMAPIQDLKLDSALVLGAGGACRGVIYGLKRLGVKEIYLSNRSQEKAESLAGEFGIRAVPWQERLRLRADLLVNTTPMGTTGEMEDKTPWESNIFPFQVVYDLVYNPLHTKLLRQARDHGAHTVSGLSMFVHQGLRQFKLWTGQSFDPTWAEKLLSNEQ